MLQYEHVQPEMLSLLFNIKNRDFTDQILYLHYKHENRLRATERCQLATYDQTGHGINFLDPPRDHCLRTGKANLFHGSWCLLRRGTLRWHSGVVGTTHKSVYKLSCNWQSKQRHLSMYSAQTAGRCNTQMKRLATEILSA